MIQIIPSEDRHFFDGGWLKTHWHFSFSDYYDPSNMGWGALRVFNEDWISPASGFPQHSHNNMEVITYVISGVLTHRDSLGNVGKIRPGEVQCMAAGTGITHAEFNQSAGEEVHLLQMWVVPGRKGLAPGWEQKQFTNEQRLGRLLPVVSSASAPLPDTLRINQDATFFIGTLRAGQSVKHDLATGRHGYLFVIDGEVTLNGQTLRKGDQARIKDEPSLEIAAAASTELVLWDTV